MMNNLILNLKIKRRDSFVRKFFLYASITLIIVFLLFPNQVKNFTSFIFNNFFSSGLILEDFADNTQIVTKSKFVLVQENLSYKRENEILKQNQIFNPEPIEREIIEVKIVSRPPFTKNSLIIVDEGRNAGIQVEGLVFTENSFIIGMVFKLNNTSAEILPFVSSFAENNYTVGSYTGIGNGRDTDILIKVPETSKVVEGEQVDIVIGENTYPIGTVNRIESQEGELTQNVYVQPIINIRELGKVFILKY